MIMQKREGIPRLSLPLGFRFQATDEELILGHLKPRYEKQNLPFEFIKSSDDVYEKPPSAYCTNSTAFFGGDNIAKHYFFTDLHRASERADRLVGSSGSWHQSQKYEIKNNNNEIIGYRKTLKFIQNVEGEKTPTDWSMQEFSLFQQTTNLVLCVIQNKVEKGTGYHLVLDLDSGSGSGRLEIAQVKSCSEEEIAEAERGTAGLCHHLADNTVPQFDEEKAVAVRGTAGLYHHLADNTVPQFDEEMAEAERGTGGLYHHLADNTIPQFDEEMAEAEGGTGGLYHHLPDNTVPLLNEDIESFIQELLNVPLLNEDIESSIQELQELLNVQNEPANENPCPAQDEETQQSKKMCYNTQLEDELNTAYSESIHLADNTIPQFDEEMAEAEGGTGGLYHHLPDNTVPLLNENIESFIQELLNVPLLNEDIESSIQELRELLNVQNEPANENPCPAQDEETQQSKKMCYNTQLEDELNTAYSESIHPFSTLFNF